MIRMHEVPWWVALLAAAAARGARAVAEEARGEASVLGEHDGTPPSEAAPEPAPAEEEPAAAPTDLPEFETVVRAAAPPATASERRITGRAIESAPRRSTDDLLRLVPGMLVVQHGAEGKGRHFFLRGFDAAHGTDVEVTLDGLPLNEVSNVHGHGYLDLYFLPPEAVESIDVLPGPFQLTQGDFATAGTIRLVPGIPRDRRGTRFSYEAGLTNRHRLAGIHAPEGTASFLATEAVTDDGYGEDRWNRRVALFVRLDDEEWARGFNILAALHTGEFGSPNAIRREDVRDGTLGFLDTYTHGLEGRSARALLVVTRTFGDNEELRLRAAVSLRRFALDSNYTGWLRHAADGDFRRQTHDAAKGFASVWWTPSYRLLDRPLALRFGAQWRGDQFVQTDGFVRMPSREVWLVERDAVAQVHHAALAVGASWSAASWLQADLGLRADLFGVVFTDRLAGDIRQDDVLATGSPRVSLRFPVSQDWTLYASYGRGHRSPEARSVATGRLPTEDVPLDAYRGGEARIATSDSVETGARWTFSDRAEISVAGFATFLENEMVYDHVSNTNLELDATRRLGGELSLRLSPWAWLELHADVTGVDARFVRSERPVPGAPRFLTTFGARFSHPVGVRAALSGFYMAPRPLAHGATGGYQFILHLTAAYRWRFLEVHLEVQNLLDADWAEGEYHFASWFDRDEPRSAIPVTHVTAGPPFDLRGGVTVWL